MTYREGIIWGLEVKATLLVLVAVWLIGSQDVMGQWVMLAAQACWACVAMAKGMNALLVQSVILGVLTVRAIIEWGAR